MINDIKDVQTSYNLNPQRFGALKCRSHPDQFVNWVSLENDKEAKLFCNSCFGKEKDFDVSNQDSFKKQNQLIEFKTFLKNLYTYCTLEDNDPDRFSSEYTQCLDGAKQQEKLKLYMQSVSQIKNDLKKEFTRDFISKIEEFQKEIVLQVEKVKQTFLTFFEEQIDLLFSRETLAIKQFKERGCKMILSAAKSAGASTSIQEEIVSFENLQQSINRMHAGKVELSYAKEHSLKVFKSLLQEFEKKITNESLEVIQKNFNKQVPEIQSQYLFTPWKKGNQNGNKTINFNYLYTNSPQNDLIKSKRQSLTSTQENKIANLNQLQTNQPQTDLIKKKRESLTSTSENAKMDSKRNIAIQNLHSQSNSIDTSIKKSGSNTFIIKPIHQASISSRKESSVQQKTNKQSDENYTLQINLKTETVGLNDIISPKNGYLINNQTPFKFDTKQINQILQQHSTPQSAQFAAFSSQKNQNGQQENIFRDNNLLQSQSTNLNKDGNFLQVNFNNINSINNNNKQATSSSLFQSFSSTLKTKSSTVIQPIENTQNQLLVQENQKKKTQIQKNNSSIAFPSESISGFNFQEQQEIIAGDRENKYYVLKSQNKNDQINIQRNKTPKTGIYLSPVPKEQSTQQLTTYLNVSERNNSMNNNSHSQIRDNTELESEYFLQNKMANNQQTLQNQIKNGIAPVYTPQTPTVNKPSSSSGSRMKSNIIKNVLITNSTKQINQEVLKHSKEIIQEKAFKYNILQIVRIPYQANVGINFHDMSNSQSNLNAPRARKISPDQQAENGKRSNSNSPPKDQKENNMASSQGIGSYNKLDDSSNFLIAQPDGFVCLYNVQGRNINQIFKERTHTKLNSLAIGRTGGMFFTVGEQQKNSSIKLWIFHSHQRFSELVELKMADSNIKKIYFIKEEYASRLNKLCFAIWTQQIVETAKSENNKYTNNNQSQQQFYTINKLGIWKLEFAGKKFEGAKMFNISSVELPINTLVVSIKEDEMIAYTKDTIYLYSLTNDYSSILKQGNQKFINIIKKDTLCCVRSYQQSRLTQKNFLAISESGDVYCLNEKLNILQEKSVRDLAQKHITLEDAIVYDQDCDFPENKRFLYFFKKTNTTLYVFDLENLRVIEELQSFDEIKNIFFYGAGFYLGFEQQFVRIWKPLPQKQEILASIPIYEEV
ncbi:hypothetical protein TTHERM_00827100 (macronuclear) [Tetrahymena thermophila SB210]|uniref:Uncharacterized protein n=1 Tax=Tetrahymena thermophila (strain SB210) TaxID=312017 RepID=Q22EF9_TETTS|nr:hypothetical protein TTHERM_00827100 [Tetrahymena thermophila SB210]EAR83693.1 hypothetical protein TTHERM_00827100 [Tetrahymena thermophila SB210]|eukprot:XP_001031356.1 hypothetical protein TTHERM_00827100 [Tetrahymena thermophila SB210]